MAIIIFYLDENMFVKNYLVGMPRLFDFDSNYIS